MRGFRSTTSLTRGLILLLFACALFARTLVPAGWMPIPGADGFRLTLCTGMGPMFASSHAVETGHDAKADGHGHHKHAPSHPCTFAGLSLAADGPALPTLAALVPPLPRLLLFTAVPTAAVGLGLAAPPPYQTGPPSGR